jgi:hypothetical protein
MSGPSKAVVATIPEANSSSYVPPLSPLRAREWELMVLGCRTDESAFLREFMANLEREDAAAAKH